MISLGGFAVAMAAGGLTKGEIVIQFSRIKRATHPRTFWAAVVLVGGIGIGVAIGGLWAMIFKA